MSKVIIRHWFSSRWSNSWSIFCIFPAHIYPQGIAHDYIVITIEINLKDRNHLKVVKKSLSPRCALLIRRLLCVGILDQVQPIQSYCGPIQQGVYTFEKVTFTKSLKWFDKNKTKGLGAKLDFQTTPKIQRKLPCKNFIV